MAVPLSSAKWKLRYADVLVDRHRRRLLCVREDHHGGDREAINTLAHMDPACKHQGLPIVTGSDFYSSPCVSPDGKRLAWLSWNHPNMPWDGTELWAGEFSTSFGLEPRWKR